MPKSYAPEVIADNSGTWAGNALRFTTRAAAESWVEGLRMRWMLVREIRVVESDDEPNRDSDGNSIITSESLS